VILANCAMRADTICPPVRYHLPACAIPEGAKQNLSGSTYLVPVPFTLECFTAINMCGTTPLGTKPSGYYPIPILAACSTIADAIDVYSAKKVGFFSGHVLAQSTIVRYTSVRTRSNFCTTISTFMFNLMSTYKTQAAKNREIIYFGRRTWSMPSSMKSSANWRVVPLRRATGL
jgi:hypothetical protein